ncbi:MAG TPA: hypothetical protein DEQ61_20440 [Streptomyces sp.]|nr:hypothetical protein [Streptomyces sp.]
MLPGSSPSSELCFELLYRPRQGAGQLEGRLGTGRAIDAAVLARIRGLQPCRMSHSRAGAIPAAGP